MKILDKESLLELVCLKENKISAAVAGRYGWDQIILASEKAFNVKYDAF